MTKRMCLALLLLAGTAHAEIKFAPGQRDQAFVERYYPVTLADRQALTAATLKGWSQEQLDQLYMHLGSGPIPSGDFKGTILSKNALVGQIEQEVIDTTLHQGVLGGFFKRAAIDVICGMRDRLECVGEYLWKGKRFYAPDAEGTVQLRNAISTRLRDPLLLNSAGLMDLMVPLGQAKIDNFGGQNMMMLFPANVFCGISLFDTRRESIVIDYAYGDDFRPYIPEVDSLVGRNGKWIRDEIRMIRPGLYLGRAYVEKFFLVNFILEQTSAPNPSWANTCWGTNSWQ